MRKLSSYILYLVIFVCLIICSSCRLSEVRSAGPGSGVSRIDNIIFVGDLARGCGCTLQYPQEWDRLSHRTVFISNFRTGVARMNFNGYDAELRECQTVKPWGNLRRGDHFYTDYSVTRILDRPDIYRPNPRIYRERDLYPEDYYPEIDPRYPEDDNRRRDRQPERRSPSDYGPAPGSNFPPGSYLQDDRDYDPNRDSRNRRDYNPWPDFSEIDVRVEFIVVGPCRRWDDPRCRENFVDAKIIVFRNKVQQHELKTTGSCGCI
jgi:hypothetical protein